MFYFCPCLCSLQNLGLKTQSNSRVPFPSFLARPLLLGVVFTAGECAGAFFFDSSLPMRKTNLRCARCSSANLQNRAEYYTHKKAHLDRWFQIYLTLVYDAAPATLVPAPHRHCTFELTWNWEVGA